jgi:hypothetical protein
VELGLQQRLAHAGDVAVAEDAETAGEQRVGHAVPLAALGREEPDDGLPDGEPHASLLNGSRGSIAWSAQVERTQACAGSSLISQARSAAGPAITLR